MKFKNMKGVTFGSSNPGSIQQTIYYALVDDFDTIADYMANPTTLAEKCKIVDPHSFLAGKGWNKIVFTKDSGNLSMEYPEQFDVTGGRIVVPIKYPGNDEEVAGFMEAAQTAKVIALVPDKNGKLVQVGTKLSPAQFMPKKYDSGKTAKDYNGNEIELIADMPRMTFYSGSIPENQLAPEESSS